MKKKIMTMAMMALAFTACTEEDLMQPTQGDAGTLHITSVTIDGQEVARTRLVADEGYIIDDELPYNQSFNGFTEGDWLELDINNLYAEDTQGGSIKATYNGIEGWSIGGYLRPSEGKTWAEVGLKAGISVVLITGGTEEYSNLADYMGVVQGDIDESNSYIYGDWLTAETNNGTITIDTDVKSPTLGAVTIRLKHAYALLRLPQSAANVTSGTYIVNGTAHNVTGLGTLWAVLNTSSTSEGEDGTETTTSTTIYCPLTKVTIGEADFLQAIVPADTEGIYTLTGFKAVMLTEESGASGEETTQNSELTTQNSLTLDLPFKVGTETSIELQSNYRYPLTLNIAPHTTSVTLSGELGKPGWGTEEEDLSNEMNELLITVDGTQYIKLDGTATDVEKVKSIIETATAAGYTNFYVTGEKLTAYSNGTAKSVVGGAIRQLAEETTVSLLVPEATVIGDQAFWGCAALASVSLPEATSIGTRAFASCTALTSVSLPAAETIGNGSFATCAALTSVSLPSATTIGIGAFASCAALASVSLPVATSIGNQAFYDCYALTSVLLPVATSIGDQAFFCCNALASVSAPKATTIGNQAFYGCRSLTSLTFGEVITSVGTNVFDGVFADGTAWTTQCALTLNSGQLSSTDLAPSGNTWAGKTWASISYLDDEGNAVIDGAATDADAVTAQISAALAAGQSTIYVAGTTLGTALNNAIKAHADGTIDLILADATAIGESAFHGCTALTSVSAPAATSIGNQAFYDCSKLTSVSAPAATSIGNQAFFSCSKLTSVSAPAATSIGYEAFFSCSKLTSVSLPAATSIGNQAFLSCSKLTSVSAPAATSIGTGAFNTCTALTSVSLPSVTTIGDYAFRTCTALTSVELPEATTIGESAFGGCTALTSVELPEATTIEDFAFISCSKLASVSAPKAETIGACAFQGCSALTSVELPEATTIGEYAFRNCTALTSLTFGSVITSMGTDAFNEVPTENCDLTLNSDQQDSTNYPVGTDGNGKPTWAGKTWASITLKVVTDK